MNTVNINAENIHMIKGETIKGVMTENGTVTIICDSGKSFFLFASSQGVSTIIMD